MRPLWVEFPEDQSSFDIDYEHLIGSALLVRPVVTEGANTAPVYFPPGIWYDVLDLTTYTGPASVTVPAPRDKVGLVFISVWHSFVKLDEKFIMYIHCY